MLPGLRHLGSIPQVLSLRRTISPREAQLPARVTQPGGAGVPEAAQTRPRLAAAGQTPREPRPGPDELLLGLQSPLKRALLRGVGKGRLCPAPQFCPALQQKTRLGKDCDHQGRR